MVYYLLDRKSYFRINIWLRRSVQPAKQKDLLFLADRRRAHPRSKHESKQIHCKDNKIYIAIGDRHIRIKDTHRDPEND